MPAKCPRDHSRSPVLANVANVNKCRSERCGDVGPRSERCLFRPYKAVVGGSSPSAPTTKVLVRGLMVESNRHDFAFCPRNARATFR